MPSKKRKYNARFPAGRIKKIMQTDEEVGKVAQAVPIIISRTLEMFVESLLKQAMQVTVSRNAKTLSPSHVKQCILAESRFDFLKDLVKNIPDVSAAEEKELQMSAESSPNSSRFPDATATRRIARQDSNSSSSSEVKPSRETIHRPPSEDIKPKVETVTTEAIDLTTKKEEPRRIANFYQETLLEPTQHRSVITVNPTYNCPQPSTSYTNMTAVTTTVPILPAETVQRIDAPKPTPLKLIDLVDLKNNRVAITPPRTPITPVINIDFSKNLANPVIQVLDNSVATMVGVKDKIREKLQRQHSKSHKTESKKDMFPIPTAPVNIDLLNAGDLQIDEDYDT